MAAKKKKTTRKKVTKKTVAKKNQAKKRKTIRKSTTKSTKTAFQQKFIFVTGGVVSSVGKGLTAASIGTLLESRGFTVSLMKCDPYINVDPGTMSPLQHGEVYVTEDGGETDLDLGHYERFTSISLGKTNSISAGQVYDSVITRERRGDYLGGTVQVIPHITDEIKARIFESGQGAEVVIVEIGGTVGDIEGLPFIEAIRQMRADVGIDNSVFIHVTYVPYIAAAGELKSKPTQHSVKELREVGIQPDFLICRSDRHLNQEIKNKIGLFCSVNSENVVAATDASTIYEVPLVLHRDGLDEKLVERLALEKTEAELADWEDMVQCIHRPENEVTVGIVGKYVDLKESYKSLHESMVHGGIPHNAKVNLVYIDSEMLNEKNTETALQDVDAILVPGGFGERGIQGKLRAIRYARENSVPFFGICLGMQLATIDFARNVCGIKDATSREFSTKKSKNLVIDIMENQKNIKNKGGTMRLGAYPCHLATNTKAHRIYAEKIISERHRHRFEFNNKFRDLLQKRGLVLSGICKEHNLVEIVELPDHPWFIGVQFHPEFKSKPLEPHPLFQSFIEAGLKYKNLHKIKTTSKRTRSSRSQQVANDRN